MTHRLLAWLLVLGCVAGACGQTASDPNEGTRLERVSGNLYAFSWWGRAGRSYFVQRSDDLVTWIYLPDVAEGGDNLAIHYGFTNTGSARFFLRLRSAELPFSADVDGDGVSNGNELQNGTNPLHPDTDGDGFTDAEELANGTDGTRAGPAVVLTAPSGATLIH